VGAIGLFFAVGALIQACSDNKGPAGPSRTAAGNVPTTGFANTSAEIRVQVGVNPNSITPGRRAGITAFVTNLNGQPLAGKMVQFSTDVGKLDTTVGTTNAAGQFSTALFITAADAANATTTFATVTAIVDGAVGTGIVNFGGNVVLVMIPDTVTRNFGATPTGGPGATPGCANIGGFTATFTVTGGVPPYKFSTSGAFTGATISSAGVYTAPAVFGPVAQNTEIIDTVTVVDSLGATDSSTVNVKCIQPAT
jgi:hypothetical protein